MKDLTPRLLQFLNNSPSCYHAVWNLKEELVSAGYRLLSEAQPWKLHGGDKCVVVRGDSALIAFRIPQGTPAGFLMSAAHSDSPTFKLREKEEVEADGTLLLSVEPYGGSIYGSWLDRPLSVAGRVMAEVDGAIVTRLVDLQRDLFVMPSLAIHMNRKVNEGAALKPNIDLRPLGGSASCAGKLRTLTVQAAGVAEEAILASELFLYPRVSGTLVGLEEEYILSPRLDDLQCVFACKEGFLQAEASDSVPVMCVLNNEEVGSCTAQGADSGFLQDTLERISEALGRNRGEHCAALAESFLVSADNAHAVHPNHPEYADANERAQLNGGVVIKYNANQRYATDGVSAAVFRKVCKMADVPVQAYSNRADLPGGSTLGNISTAHVSVPTVDVGLAQLAMHAACELAGVQDTAHLVRAMQTYFGQTLRRMEDGFRLG